MRIDCSTCIHFMQETIDDVACCNCCEEENISFYEEYRGEYTLDDFE